MLKELISKKCLRCNHEWFAIVENPVTCPKCKSPIWNKPRKEKKEE